MQSTQTARRATFTNELASVYLRLYKGWSWRRCRAINYSKNCRKVDTPFSDIADSEEKIHRTSNRKEFSLKGSSYNSDWSSFSRPRCKTFGICPVALALPVALSCVSLQKISSWELCIAWKHLKTKKAEYFPQVFSIIALYSYTSK